MISIGVCGPCTGYRVFATLFGADRGRVHGDEHDSAVHCVPAGRPEEQPTSRGTAADQTPRDEPHVCSTGTPWYRLDYWLRNFLVVGFANSFATCCRTTSPSSWLHTGTGTGSVNCHAAEPDAHHIHVVYSLSLVSSSVLPHPSPLDCSSLLTQHFRLASWKGRGFQLLRPSPPSSDC